MVLFRKKKKQKTKASVGGFFKDKFIGDFDLSDAGVRTVSFIKKKVSDGIQGIYDSRDKLKDIPGTNYKLGLYHMQQGNFYDAIFRFGIVCRFAPDNIDAHYNLARCYMFRGANKEAKKKLEHVLKKIPDHVEAKYLLKKIDSPKTVEFIPESLIKETIDIRADFYRQDYIDNGYSGSKALVNEVFRNVNDKNPNYDVLDLGCGTGVCGFILKKRSLARRIVGVDLSKIMIETCREKRVESEPVYDELHEAEISKYLQSEQSKYNLVLSDLATDFIGKLDGYAVSIKRVLVDGGCYAAVVRWEDELKEGYKLNSDYEEFSYSKKYFVDNFAKAGLKLTGSNEIDMVGDEKAEILIFKS